MQKLAHCAPAWRWQAIATADRVGRAHLRTMEGLWCHLGSTTQAKETTDIQNTLKAKDRKKWREKTELALPSTGNLLLQGCPLHAVPVRRVCSPGSTRDVAAGCFVDKGSFPSTHRREQRNTATVNANLKLTLCVFTARSIHGQHKNLLHWQGLTTKFLPKTSQFAFASKTSPHLH